MRRLCVDPAAVEISSSQRKVQENLTPCDQYEYPGHLTLKFSNNISGPIYTGLPLGDQEGRTLDLHLIDSRTQNIINSGPEASEKVEIIVLEKDRTSYISDKSPIRGNPQVSLKDGSVSVSHISFKHTRVPMKKRELRLGARVVCPRDIGTRIVEAVTEPFFVKDRRSMGKSLKPLILDDEVWKLQRIGKGGPFHNRLMNEKIFTVRDFLIYYFLYRENLLKILGRRMHAKKLDEAINQAKSKLELKRCVYPRENPLVVFTDVGELIAVQLEGQFVPVEQLTQIQKDDARNLVICAFRHRKEVVFFEDESSLIDWVMQISPVQFSSNSPMASGVKIVKTAFEDGHQNFKVLLDDGNSQMLCSASSSPNKAADQLDGYNGFNSEANFPTDTQQLQPVIDAANYMPSTSLINNCDFPTDTHLLDPDDIDSFYQVLPSIWDY